MNTYITLLCMFLTLFVVCSADDVVNEQVEVEGQDLDSTKDVEKRIPHPSWRSKGKVQHFQHGEMPPFSPRQFVSFNGPRFYRYARRPFSIDFDW